VPGRRLARRGDTASGGGPVRRARLRGGRPGRVPHPDRGRLAGVLQRGGSTPYRRDAEGRLGRSGGADLGDRHPAPGDAYVATKHGDSISRGRAGLTTTSALAVALVLVAHAGAEAPTAGQPELPRLRVDTTPTRSEEHTSELQSRVDLVC